MPRSPTAELVPLAKLLADDRRYKFEAYQFVGAGLEYAQEVLGMGKPSKGRPRKKGQRQPRHITGQELCWALKDLAQRQYGRMAKLVLASWGVHSTRDFGEIVFNLIRIGKMSQSEQDRLEDFDKVYEFEQTLVREYVITTEDETCRP